MTDTLREVAVVALVLGDFDSDEDMRLFSGFRLLLLLILVEKATDNLGAGCIERALVDRDTLSCLVLSPDSTTTDSVDDRGPSLACLSGPPDNRLGRRFTASLLLLSLSVTPGPIDFLGGLAIMVLLETGG